MKHIPVLVQEVLQYLNPKANQDFIDCTLGLGGHARAIMEKTAPKGKLLAIEQDTKGLNEAKKNLRTFKNRIIYHHSNFVNLRQIARYHNFSGVSGILFDLGLALWQIEEGDDGFSFEKNSQLDMRMYGAKISAAEIVNKYHFDKLAKVFYGYGDLKNSRFLARKIIAARSKKPIGSTADLVEVIGTKNPRVLALIWQALRIEVNHELENLKIALTESISLLKDGGRIAVISFHSGEDRIVKNFFRSNSDQLKTLTKKPVRSSAKEINHNPHSRSAKMRIAERIR